jgi:CO/xanthine dehydrogenase FAD-binding subunit
MHHVGRAGGGRHGAADDFLTGMFATPLEPDELIAHVHLPVPKRAAHLRLPQPASHTPAEGLVSDIHASGDYRAHLVTVVAMRAVAAAD